MIEILFKTSYIFLYIYKYLIHIFHLAKSVKHTLFIFCESKCLKHFFSVSVCVYNIVFHMIYFPTKLVEDVGKLQYSTFLSSHGDSNMGRNKR